METNHTDSVLQCLCLCSLCPAASQASARVNNKTIVQHDQTDWSPCCRSATELDGPHMQDPVQQAAAARRRQGKRLAPADQEPA